MKKPKISLTRKTLFIYKSSKNTALRLTNLTDPTGTMTTNSTTVSSTASGMF